MDFITLAELVLGPLMLALARVPHLAPAPGGIVVSPTAPVLDMNVIGSAGVTTSQRPQPSQAADAAMLVTIEPGVTLASPEALDRLAYALESDPVIAVRPWQRTVKRYEALSTFFVLASAMTRQVPTGLVARRAGATDRPRVYAGGHIVAERRYSNGVRELIDGWTRRIVETRAAHPLGLLCTIAFFYGAAATFVRLVVDPSWAHFGWYAAFVFAISLCLRQVGKFARLATAIYPVTLAFFFVIAARASFKLRSDRVRAARVAKRS